VVDVNPRRQGHFMPVTGQPIVAPTALPAIDPQVIVITNELYRDEITRQARALGLRSEILVA